MHEKRYIEGTIGLPILWLRIAPGSPVTAASGKDPVVPRGNAASACPAGQTPGRDAYRHQRLPRLIGGTPGHMENKGHVLRMC